MRYIIATAFCCLLAPTIGYVFSNYAPLSETTALICGFGGVLIGMIGVLIYKVDNQ